MLERPLVLLSAGQYPPEVNSLVFATLPNSKEIVSNASDDVTRKHDDGRSFQHLGSVERVGKGQDRSRSTSSSYNMK